MSQRRQTLSTALTSYLPKELIALAAAYLPTAMEWSAEDCSAELKVMLTADGCSAVTLSERPAERRSGWMQAQSAEPIGLDACRVTVRLDRSGSGEGDTFVGVLLPGGLRHLLSINSRNGVVANHKRMECLPRWHNRKESWWPVMLGSLLTLVMAPATGSIDIMLDGKPLGRLFDGLKRLSEARLVVIFERDSNVVAVLVKPTD